MADGFETMVDAALPFFHDLAENNSKDWFAPRKDHYTDAIKKPAELFGSLISEDLARITGRGNTFKLFRIYRDVRFSKDKTPLNAHLHMSWSDTSGEPLSPTWFFGLSPEYFFLGMGVMGMKGEVLARFRAHIDTKGGDITNALDIAAKEAGARLSDWGGEPLKRVPKPYEQDHPYGDLLRRKSITVTADIAQDWRETGLIKAVTQRITHLNRVAQVLQV